MLRRLTPLILCALLAVSACATSAGESGGERARCPEGRDYGEMFCSEIRRYARDPETGQCCRYQSHCATPTGWKTYPTEEACEAADAE